MNIVLIGYRATGKSTLARMLAERLGWQYLDVDDEIERRAGKTIARIFAEDGEPAFRDLESEVVADLCSRENAVIAAGGGTPMRETNRHVMKNNGKIVWLKAKPETIHARMTADAATAQRRPNLTDKGGFQEILDLLAVREPVYRQLADVEIDTEGKPPEVLLEEILEKLQLQ